MDRPPIYQCKGPVTSLCATPELGAFAVGDSSGGLYLIDMESHAVRYELRHGSDKEPVLAVAFAPELRALFSAQSSFEKDSFKVIVWDADSGAVRAEMNYKKYITTLIYVPELRAMVSGDANVTGEGQTGNVVMWNPHSLEVYQKMPCKGAVTSVTWAVARRLLISSDRSRCIRFWQPDSGEVLSEIETSQVPWCLSMPSDPGRTTLAVSQCNFKENFGDVSICDSEGQIQFAEQLDSPVLCIVFLPEAPVVACGCRAGDIVIWDFEARTRRKTIRVGAAVNALVYHPASGQLVAGCKNGELRSWALADLLSG